MEDILRQAVETGSSGSTAVVVPPMTEEGRARAREAIANVKRLRAELFEKHGPSPDSSELINEARALFQSALDVTSERSLR